MPIFNALAGFSPNCCAVLVQMLHCAETSAGSKKNSINSTNNITHPLMVVQLPCKSTTKDGAETGMTLRNLAEIIS